MPSIIFVFLDMKEIGPDTEPTEYVAANHKHRDLSVPEGQLDWALPMGGSGIAPL